MTILVSKVDKYTHFVASAEEALALAQNFKAEGRFDVFRGQARRWTLLSSLHRLGESRFDEMTERGLLLYQFMGDNPVLKPYLKNTDHFFAVAQHYGFATNHVDFTTDPAVALYFATNSPANTVLEQACIICVNRVHFQQVMEFTEPLWAKYMAKKDLRPCFLEMDVKNLWRLQAQKGLFLFTPLAQIENVYPFHRIVFPYHGPFPGIDIADIYPVEKSVVETYLDHFLEAERTSNNMQRFIKVIGHNKVHHGSEPNIFDYLLSSCRPHRS